MKILIEIPEMVSQEQAIELVNRLDVACYQEGIRNYTINVMEYKIRAECSFILKDLDNKTRLINRRNIKKEETNDG